MAALQKFVTQVKTSATHLTGNVQLQMPAVEFSPSDPRDDDLLLVLEAAMHEWTDALQSVKAAELAKQAAMSGPLDEIQYWSERNNVLGGLHEQISLPEARNVIQYASLRLLCL